MKLHFSKYQGTGNDFIVVDNRSGEFKPRVDQIVKLCDRRFGIGSDGLILIEETGFSDFYMNFFNPDGSQSFCGNGSRCAVRFAQKLGLVGASGEFKAIDTKHDFTSDDEIVSIRMKTVLGIDRENEDFIIHTGSPHYIIYKDGIDGISLVEEARKIRYNDRFKEEGINVNYVEEHSDYLKVRTYERGVEEETLSCGTGVTAMALSYGYLHAELNAVQIETRGGKLEVTFRNLGNGEFEDVWLKGPANFVYEGELEI
ncbi:MAG: diaminopimelate epimerase [Flavobacteriales bacterium]